MEQKIKNVSEQVNEAPEVNYADVLNYVKNLMREISQEAGEPVTDSNLISVLNDDKEKDISSIKFNKNKVKDCNVVVQNISNNDDEGEVDNREGVSYERNSIGLNHLKAKSDDFYVMRKSS